MQPLAEQRQIFQKQMSASSYGYRLPSMSTYSVVVNTRLAPGETAARHIKDVPCAEFVECLPDESGGFER
jgi:hypothetical protein